MALERRVVQRALAVGLRGHRAGHRPQDVAHRAEAAIEGRQEDVGAALGHGPPREGATGGRAAEATTETQNLSKFRYKN